MLAATALAVLTGCQSAVEKQRLDSGDLLNCARIRVVSSGCGRNSGLTKVYVDNMHKDHTVRATVRKHSQEGDDNTEYAIAEGGQLFVGCGGSGTSFDVVGWEVLKGEAEKVIKAIAEITDSNSRKAVNFSSACNETFSRRRDARQRSRSFARWNQSLIHSPNSIRPC